MNLNRYFFSCPTCLLHFTADHEGNAPKSPPCPICGGWVRCLGATRGIFSMEVPCNDSCTHAKGRNCTCSCGGKNHGSHALVPVIRGAVDFSTKKVPGMDEIRRLWEQFKAMEKHLRDHAPERIAQAQADYQAGKHLERQAWNDRHAYFRGVNALASAGSYPNRTKCIKSFCERWALPFPSVSSVVAAPGPASGSSVVADLPLFRLL